MKSHYALTRLPTLDIVAEKVIQHILPKLRREIMNDVGSVSSEISCSIQEIVDTCIRRAVGNLHAAFSHDNPLLDNTRSADVETQTLILSVSEHEAKYINPRRAM